MKQTALVISGGGSKGAFAVGAIWSIYRRFRSTGWFSVVGGSSTGALIAPLASLLAAPEPMSSNALKTMVYFYSHLQTADVLVRKNLIGLIQEQNCLNRYAPLKSLIEKLFLPECYQWLCSSEAPYCYVVYVNYQSAKKVYVSPKDPGMTREKFIKSILASVSVPVFVEPTIIDGDACFDGGVRDIVPFERAVEWGAESILPIFLHPQNMEHSDDSFKRIDRVLLRTLSIMMDETTKNDYETARLINLGAKLRTELLALVKGMPFVEKRVKEIFSRDEYAGLVGKDKNLVDIIDGVRPDHVLTEDILKLEPVEMKQWMKLGYKKADDVVLRSPFSS